MSNSGTWKQIQYSKIFCFLTVCSVYVVTINILFGHLFWFTTFYKVSKIQLVEAVTLSWHVFLTIKKTRISFPSTINTNMIYSWYESGVDPSLDCYYNRFAWERRYCVSWYKWSYIQQHSSWSWLFNYTANQDSGAWYYFRLVEQRLSIIIQQLTGVCL